MPPSPDRAAAAPESGLRAGVVRGFPIALAYAPVGFAFGVLASQNGMSPGMAAATSLLVLSGAGQFIAISLWFSGAGIVSTLAAVFVSNLRYTLMSAALAPHVKPLRGAARLLFGWEVTDELFAVHIAAFTRGWRLDLPTVFAANFSAHCSWVLGTLVGAILGGAVTEPRAFALDYAMTAMFLALLVPQCASRLHILVAVLAAFFSVALKAAGFGSWNVFLATVLAASVGTWIFRSGKRGGDGRARAC